MTRICFFGKKSLGFVLTPFNFLVKFLDKIREVMRIKEGEMGHKKIKCFFFGPF
jgi:hypothetical protein